MDQSTENSINIFDDIKKGHEIKRKIKVLFPFGSKEEINHKSIHKAERLKNTEMNLHYQMPIVYHKTLRNKS